MTSHEKLQKGEAAIYGKRVEGSKTRMDEAEREESRRFLAKVIEMYESGDPNRQTESSESGETP